MSVDGVSGQEGDYPTEGHRATGREGGEGQE